MHSWIKAVSGAIVAQRGPGRSAATVCILHDSTVPSRFKFYSNLRRKYLRLFLVVAQAELGICGVTSSGGKSPIMTMHKTHLCCFTQVISSLFTVSSSPRSSVGFMGNHF